MKKIVLLSLLFLSSFSFAQNFLGVHASNYAGIHGLDFQPASFVDGRFKFDMTLPVISFNTGIWTNGIYFDTKNMPKWWAKSFKADDITNTNGSISQGVVAGGTNPDNDWQLPTADFFKNNFKQTYDTNSTKTIGVYQNIQIDLLQFAFHFNKKNSLGFSIKAKEVFNILNLDPKLAILAQNDLNVQSLWNQKFNEELVRVSQMSWLEYGVNYGHVIKDEGEHFMKAGATLKFLAGYTSAYVYTSNFDYGLNNADTTFFLKGDFNYGYSRNLDDVGGSLNSLGLPKMASKLGLGGDLGFVYEWRPNFADHQFEMDNVKGIWRKSQNKYKLRAGASILDLGGMRFQKGELTRDLKVNKTVAFDINTFTGANSLYNFDSIVDSLTTFDPTSFTKDPNSKDSYYMNTPTTLGLSVDYHIWKIFYVNASGILNLNRKKDAHAIRVPNQISITPSLDYSWFGLHFPFSYNSYSGAKQGLAARLGPVTLGWVDMRSLFAKGKIYGAELYASMRIPILFGEPNDKDDDHVSDKLDECKDVPGIWSFNGCPDTDGDGVKDSEDTCPNDAGLVELKGCPDKDGDKIPDIEDECPTVPGIAYFKGCPDVDNDTIMDLVDDCPDVAGLKIFNGCPDRDKDGVKDGDDLCPDNAGPIANQGCPDSDNDGIYDFVDTCPIEFGPKENNGCPWPDTDKDGLLDKDDDCPNLAGPMSNKGCPLIDTDKDGVLDKDDDCPSVPGIKANKGCPEIKKEEQEILNTAFEDLEFNTGNAIIKQESYASLDRLAALLVKKQAWKLSVSGHTDSQGDDAKNMILSKQRAEAVKAYLASKGVAPERLKTFFYGETKPIATNDTPEGRQKNRRVEMKVLFE